MSLAEQLRNVLPTLLPTTPETAILGTELLEQVRPKITGQYSDHSIRQTFSSLAADPTSPLARVEQGFGYYLRPTIIEQETPQREAPQSEAPAASDERVESSRADQLEEKFRSFFVRNSLFENRFPVHIEHTSATRQPAGVNKWKFPDVVELDWNAGEATEDGFVLDKAVLEVKRSLGEQPFRLASVELKVELSLSNFRQHFFQCVSNSMWSHAATLVVAAPIVDSLLAGELRRLGTSYGVQIHSFDLSVERLGQLPNADQILALRDDEFERLRGDIKPAQISSGTARSALDWDHVRDMMTQSQDFKDIFEWIARCLRDARAYSFKRYLDLREIEQEAG